MLETLFCEGAQSTEERQLHKYNYYIHKIHIMRLLFVNGHYASDKIKTFYTHSLI